MANGRDGSARSTSCRKGAVRGAGITRRYLRHAEAFDTDEGLSSCGCGRYCRPLVRAHRPGLTRLVAVALIIAVGGGLTTAALAATHGHRAKPDLVVTALSNPPQFQSAGGKIVAQTRVANIGRATARASQTLFFLSTDAK